MNIDAILGELARQPDIYDDLYGVLGCTPSNTAEQIATEYRRRTLACHPDRRPNDQDAARQEFERLNVAYGILGRETERASYERWRTSGLKVSFASWRALNERAQAVHWQPQPTQSVIDNRPYEGWRAAQPACKAKGTIATESESERLIQQFRNYEL
ncbi:hypothetical protein THASP1DRAFT_27542 [Thamnocephalis sphaerospora]|uniref:J domain-containing protein n=1 Tax=Thamnocephalis sphaerospora TaxID=78915 RepID=A0A4P9XWI1_9FUNG|nr:hypothetical protein THASP1DRAFT_27542 [Thamnocephalis sphaerospora]|eukprot:RKP10658.1 hypothetical protein THASP1DRAFT_27542 [Thamnocephalis sphaerospora]